MSRTRRRAGIAARMVHVAIAAELNCVQQGGEAKTGMRRYRMPRFFFFRSSGLRGRGSGEVARRCVRRRLHLHWPKPVISRRSSSFLVAAGSQFIVASHGPRLLRSPPSAHRIFAARWRGADEGADEKSGGIRRCRRSRLPITATSTARLNFIRRRSDAGDQADHRLRGLHGAGFDQGSAE